MIHDYFSPKQIKITIMFFIFFTFFFIIGYSQSPYTVVLKFDGTEIPDIKQYSLFKAELPDTNEFWNWDSKPLNYVPYRTVQHENQMYYLDTIVVNSAYVQFAILQMDKSGNIDKRFTQLTYVVKLQDSVITLIDVEVSNYKIKQRKY